MRLIKIIGQLHAHQGVGVVIESKEHDSIKERAKKKLERDMGPTFLEALHDPKTVEIMLNADGKLWLERQGERSQHIGSLRRAQARRTAASP
jgi:type IV secretion system protein VirB11